MKVTSYTTQEVFVDPFPGDLETLFLEKDTVSTGFTIKGKDTVKQKNALIGDTEWPALVDLGSQAEVLGLVKDPVLVEHPKVSIPDMISVPDLGGGTVDSSTTTICRLDNLSMKSLQKKHPETGLDLVYRSVYEPYDPGSGEGGHFRQVQEPNDRIYEQINRNIRRVQGSWIIPLLLLLARGSLW